MTVGTTLRAWSATAANNNPKGTDVIGTSADDELRQIQATVRQYLASQSSTVVPSAGVADLTTATGHWVPISGSATVTGLGSEDAGIEYILTFTGAPRLVNSSALSLPGAATLVGETSAVCVAESLGSGNWKIWGYTSPRTHPVRAPSKVWAALTVTGGTPAIAKGYGCSSVTDNGVGDYTFHFDTAFADANYVAVGTAEDTSTAANAPRVYIRNGGKSTTSVRIFVTNFPNDNAYDPASVSIVCFGD